MGLNTAIISPSPYLRTCRRTQPGIQTGASVKVLLVDDSMLSRKIQRRVIKEIGAAEIIEAKDGRVALEKLAEINYQVDVVLTDWNMPNLDGVSFIRELRKIPAGKDLPVIVVSSEGDREKIVHAFKSGASSYVTKPFRKEILARKVASVQNVAKLSRQPISEASITGDIGLLGFAELVQFLNFTHKSGDLKIKGEEGEAIVRFREGELNEASYGRFKSEQAFFAIARLKAGRFEFFENDSPVAKSILGSTVSLLMEAMRVIDEEEAVA